MLHIDNNIIIYEEDFFNLMEVILETSCDQTEREGACHGMALLITMYDEYNKLEYLLEVFKDIEYAVSLNILGHDLASLHNDPRLSLKIPIIKDILLTIRKLQDPDKFLEFTMKKQSLLYGEKVIDALNIPESKEIGRVVLVKKWLVVFPAPKRDLIIFKKYFADLLMQANNLHQSLNLTIATEYQNDDKSHIISLKYNPINKKLILADAVRIYIFNMPEQNIESLCNCLLASLNHSDSDWEFYLSFEIYSSEKNLCSHSFLPELCKLYNSNCDLIHDIERDINCLSEYSFKSLKEAGNSLENNQELHDENAPITLNNNTIYIEYDQYSRENGITYNFVKTNIDGDISGTINRSDLASILNQEDLDNLGVMPEGEFIGILNSKLKNKFTKLISDDVYNEFATHVCRNLLFINNVHLAEQVWNKIKNKPEFIISIFSYHSMQILIENQSIEAVQWVINKINTSIEYKNLCGIQSPHILIPKIAKLIYTALIYQSQDIADFLMDSMKLSYPNLLDAIKGNHDLVNEAKYIGDYYILKRMSVINLLDHGGINNIPINEFFSTIATKRNANELDTNYIKIKKTF